MPRHPGDSLKPRQGDIFLYSALLDTREAARLGGDSHYVRPFVSLRLLLRGMCTSNTDTVLSCSNYKDRKSFQQ